MYEFDSEAEPTVLNFQGTSDDCSCLANFLHLVIVVITITIININTYILKARIARFIIPQKNLNFPQISSKMPQNGPKMAKNDPNWPKYEPKWP